MAFATMELLMYPFCVVTLCNTVAMMRRFGTSFTIPSLGLIKQE